jgi:hypothetical protein
MRAPAISTTVRSRRRQASVRGCDQVFASLGIISAVMIADLAADQRRQGGEDEATRMH